MCHRLGFDGIGGLLSVNQVTSPFRAATTEGNRFTHSVDRSLEGRTKAELRARVGRPQTSSSPPVIFIAGRPKAALLFWFFGDFRCGGLLFMVFYVIYKYKNK